MVHFSHLSYYIGEDGGQGMDSLLSTDSDGSVIYSTSCAWWLLHLPLGHRATEASRALGYLLFHYEYNWGNSWGCHSHWSLTMKVIGG
jgi:hypothetical protein